MGEIGGRSGVDDLWALESSVDMVRLGMSGADRLLAGFEIEVKANVSGN